MVVSNIFNFHPYLGKISSWLIFFRWVETTNLGITVIWHLLREKSVRGPHVSPLVSRTAGRRPCERRSTATSTSCDIFWTPVPARTAAQTWQARKPHGGRIFRWCLTRLVSSQDRIIFSDYKDEGNCAANLKVNNMSLFWFFRMVILFKKSMLVIVWSNLVERCEYNSPRKTTVWPFQSLPGHIIQQGKLDAKALVLFKMAKSGCFFRENGRKTPFGIHVLFV